MIEPAVAQVVSGRYALLPEEDDRAVRHLLVAYGLASDFALVDELVGMFTPDALWDGREFHFPRCEGHDAIRAHFTGACPPDLRQVHTMEPPMLLAGEAPGMARGVVPFNAMQAEAEGKVIAGQQAFGLYEDLYQRDEDGWRFAARTLHLRLVRR